MIRLALFLILTSLNMAGDSRSVPMTALTSVASFTSLSNSNLTTSFLDCGNSNYKLWDIKITAKSAVTIDICNVSNSVGSCSASGNTTSATALNYVTGDIIILGYSNGSISPSEMTTGTKITGDVVAYRRCGLTYYQTDF